MLYNHKVATALEQKRSQFQEYQAGLHKQEVVLDEWLNGFYQYTLATMRHRLDERGLAWPGAYPTVEFDRAERLALPFSQRWTNHVEARAWALPTLTNRPVAAVDGSQITPTKDYSVPVGAVQIGWFINHHREGGSFVKDIRFEVLAPTEFTDDATGDNLENAYFDRQVTQLRFVLECQKLCEIMADYATADESQRPLCFFDGSFIISFAGQMLPRHAQPYLLAVRELLACSERYRVPLVAFVDSSSSRDLVSLMETLRGQKDKVLLSDAGLLKAAHLLPRWGDRTPCFLCAREDTLTREGRGDFYQDVAFCYLHLVADRPPARLEMPAWMVEAGRVEEIVDLVRAECVVGTGYPYAIESADALAVISHQDRQRFYALFEQFAQQVGLTLTQARKAHSKQMRR
jgi:hypothetical protein